MSIEFQVTTRPGLQALRWTRPDGNLALFTWGRSPAWNESTAPEWLEHLTQSISDSAEPVAGIPGPVAHLIAGFRLSAAECWRAEPEVSPAVHGVAVFHDAGRLFIVTAGPCRLFRARSRHEIFLMEPPYSEMESSLSEASLPSSSEAVLWGQDLPRPGDVYLITAGVEGEPPQGLKELLFDVHDDFAPPLEYCRGILLAGMPQGTEAELSAAARPSRAVHSRAASAILKTADPPQPLSEPVSRMPATAEEESRGPSVDLADEDLVLAGAGKTRRPGAPRVFGIIALALLAGFTAWWSLGRSNFGWNHAPWNPGTLAVASEPGGARISIDGRELGASPLQVSLKPGRHFVEARLGDLGLDTSSVWLKPGEMLAVKPRFAGDISISNQHPGLPLFAQLDGMPADSVPCVWKGVNAGRHLVSFSGPGWLPWTAEVRVSRGQISDYEASPQATGTRGTLRVATVIVGDQGRKEGRGDPVRVDSRPAGRTPLALELDTGTHSVRVDHALEEGQTQLVDVKPGQDRFVTMEFDGGRRAWVQIVTPAGGAGGSIVAATYRPGHGESVREMRLFFASPAESYFTRRAMTLLDRGRGIFAAPLPDEALAGAGWRFYVVAVDEQFNEVPTEVVAVGRAHAGGARVAASLPLRKKPAGKAASPDPGSYPLISPSMPPIAQDSSSHQN